MGFAYGDNAPKASREIGDAIEFMHIHDLTASLDILEDPDTLEIVGANVLILFGQEIQVQEVYARDGNLLEADSSGLLRRFKDRGFEDIVMDPLHALVAAVHTEGSDFGDERFDEFFGYPPLPEDEGR